MTAEQLAELLQDAVDSGLVTTPEQDAEIERVESNADGGWLTNDAGFVVHLRNRAQIHVTVTEQ